MKKKNFLVSVIMNCHNGEKYLKDSVTSLQKQKYKNWELIFWDNCSKDGSKKIIKSFKDKRIRYFLAKKFTNLHKARNLALKKAKGKYVSFLDCDDLLLEDKLLLQVDMINKKGFKFVYSNCYLFNKKTILKKKKISNKTLPEGNITNKLIDNYQVALTTILMERNILKKNFFKEKLNIIGDRDLVMRISLNEKLGCIQLPLAIYRIHDDNYSAKNRLMEIQELEKWIQGFSKKYLKKYNLDKSAIMSFKNKIKILASIYSKKGITQKIFISKNLLINFNTFNLMNFIKGFFPKFITSKIFFYNY